MKKAISLLLVVLVTAWAQGTVTWSIEPAGFGSIDAAGKYTAPPPASVTVETIVKIKATAQDGSVAVSYVKVTPTVAGMYVTPSATTLYPGATGQFATSGVPAAPPPATRTTSGFMRITLPNQIINNVRFTNPNAADHGGRCLEVASTATNLTIMNSEFDHCVNRGIWHEGASNFTIKDTYFHDIGEEAFDVLGGDNIYVHDTSFVKTGKGFFAQGATRVKVEYNSFTNMTGPVNGPGGIRGQSVQFNTVTGGGNSVSCNTIDNVLGQSDPEDHINMFQSQGTVTDPIKIIGNRIRGGGPSASGSAIQPGDGGGSHILVQYNVIVNPGQSGIGIANGTDIQVMDNLVYGALFSFSNVGMSAYNQYQPKACTNVGFYRNQVNFVCGQAFCGGAGNPNPYYFPSGTDSCYPGLGAMPGFSTNNWAANINANIWTNTISQCSQLRSARP